MDVFLKGWLVLLVILSHTTNSDAQNFIGMHKTQIMKVMKETQNNCKLNTSTINTHYNYLKYEDKIAEITILYFLSEDDRCTLVRKMCDYSNINDILAELNEKYSATGKNEWEYEENGNTYSVTLSEDDWFFTVTTQLKE
jgi:hypothetical protein